MKSLIHELEEMREKHETAGLQSDHVSFLSSNHFNVYCLRHDDLHHRTGFETSSPSIGRGHVSLQGVRGIKQIKTDTEKRFIKHCCMEFMFLDKRRVVEISM